MKRLLVLLAVALTFPAAAHAQWTDPGGTWPHVIPTALTTAIQPTPATIPSPFFATRPATPEIPTTPAVSRPAVPEPPADQGGTAAPRATTDALCVSSDPTARVTISLCADRTTIPYDEVGPVLTATVRIDGALAPDGTSCYIWGSTRTDETQRGWSCMAPHMQQTTNGSCSTTMSYDMGDWPDPVDFYAGTGAFPNVTQTPGYGLQVTYAAEPELLVAS